MAKNKKSVQKKADAKRAGTRTRNWTAIAYPEDLPEDWKEQLDELKFRWVESPLHDADVNADGKPKKPHHHLLFMLGSVVNSERVMTMLGDTFGTSESGSVVGFAEVQQVSDRGALVRYMAHLDNPDKAQYDVNEIVGHNGADPAELLRYSATETREMIIAMEEYIEEHMITELSDFSKAIRYEFPEWHTILATKMTTYFSAFIRSRRHKVYLERSVVQSQLNADVDLETGEVKERDVNE